MSRKHRKYRRRRGFPWPLVLFGGIVLAAAALIWSSWGGGDGGGTPSIAVDRHTIDYGDVNFGVKKTFAIKVTNTGDGTLRFREGPYIEILEGC